MNTFIAYQSALAVIRAARLEVGSCEANSNKETRILDLIKKFVNAPSHYHAASSLLPRATEKVTREHIACTRKTLTKLLGKEGMGDTLHLFVNPYTNRLRSKNVSCHTLNLPDRSFIKLENGVFLSTPESLFLQMASQCSFWELIELGYELCGTYSKDVHGFSALNNKVVSCSNVTTVKHLESYLDRCKNVSGLRKAKSALRFIVDNSASPMESAVAMMLFLSQHHGGYGLPLAQMNYRIDIPSHLRSYTKYRICDFYWPKHKIALEYDSNAFHRSDLQKTSDSIRRNDLFNSGVTVLSLSSKQFQQLSLFDRQVSVLEKCLKHRRQITSTGLKRKAELHRYVTRYTSTCIGM